LENRPEKGASLARPCRRACPPAVRQGARLWWLICLFFSQTSVYTDYRFSPERKSAMELPSPGMTIDVTRTALVITDLQNDFLSPGGIAWALVAESLAEINTIANIESLLKAAKRHGVLVVISPHYYYPTDRAWVSPGGALESLMEHMGVFA